MDEDLNDDGDIDDDNILPPRIIRNNLRVENNLQNRTNQRIDRFNQRQIRRNIRQQQQTKWLRRNNYLFLITFQNISNGEILNEPQRGQSQRNINSQPNEEYILDEDNISDDINEEIINSTNDQSDMMT